MTTDIEAPTATTSASDTEVRSAPPARRRVRRGWFAAVWPPVVFAGIVIGFWYFARQFLLQGRRRVLLPAPHTVWSKAFAVAKQRDVLRTGLINTSKVAFIGLIIAIALGCTFAVLMHQARWVERSFFPWAVLLQTVPILAVTPLIQLWFGFEFKARVVVCVIIALFPIITNTLFGLQSVDEGMHDLFTLHDASRATRLRKLEAPAALPAVFEGFRIAAGLSVIGTVVGEFFFRRGEKGIGHVIERSRALPDYPLLLAAVICACALGVVVFLVFSWLANRFSRWHASSATAE